uniref:Neural proliferation, differentiation and control, 1b n=1 Tax=Oryzias melastigma TaxID=30732 RepID=A0A3B3BRY4_ORYME
MTQYYEVALSFKKVGDPWCRRWRGTRTSVLSSPSVSSTSAGSDLCPRSLDCARAGRHFCQAGTSRCGPCLHPLVEDSRGHCIVRRRHGTSHPELDEEIDFLSAIISEQRTESLDANRTAVVPTSQAHLSSSWAPPTTTNHTPVPHRDPIILPFPSSDRLFVSKCLLLTFKRHIYLEFTRKENEDLHRDEPKVPDSGASTDEENEDGDFTVYECPGLAPTGEMEVKNPLFDDSTLYLQRLHQ